MNRPAQTLCLNMIVRNESAVIERCLASVKARVHHWVIVDTGSVDGTQDIVRRFLQDVPGELVERPWRDFGHNRTEALRLAEGKGDYLLFIDADEVLEFAPGFAWPLLTADAYRIETRVRGLSYRRLQLVKNSADWHYQGVLHESITSHRPKTIERLDGVIDRPRQDGARSADPNKFRRDALILQTALLEAPDNSRYVLYLANSHRDGGDYQAALAQYRHRERMGGDAQELWYAAYQAGLMLVLLGGPWETALEALLQAYARDPTRAEPLYHVALHYRIEQQYALAELFAQRAVALSCPDDGLFIDRAAYAWRIPFEWAVCCYRAGRHAEAVRFNNQVLAADDVASEIFAQALKNRHLSLEALHGDTPNEADKACRFKIFVPLHNPGTCVDDCIASLLVQRHREFSMIFLDLGCSDGSVQEVPLDDERTVLIRADAPTSLAEVRHRYIVEHCAAEDVVLLLDGAHSLAHHEVLAALDRRYQRSDCELVQAQYQQADGRYGRCLPYPDAASLQRLDHAGGPMGLLSFRAGLYQRIADRLASIDEAALLATLQQEAGFARQRFDDAVMMVLNDAAASPV